MTAVVDAARVLRHAVGFAVSDLGAIYTWQSWVFGWVLRVVMQIVFYALIGVLLDDPAAVAFLVIGNVALMASANVMLAIPSTQWERYTGTLPLLVAAPSRVMWVFLGRSVEWLADALATSLIALAVVPLVFDVRLGASTSALVALLLGLVIVASYGQATLLGAVVLSKPDIRNVVSNAAIGTMAIVTGANVPVTFFATPVRWLAQIFPLTHGLEAIRGVIAGFPASSVLADVGWCLAVGAAWMVAAAAVFERFAEAGRRDGSIDFES